MTTQIITDATPIRAWITIDREAAILAGHSRYGQVLVEIDPADLGAEERAALARLPSIDCSGGRSGYGINLHYVTSPRNLSYSVDCPPELRTAVPDASATSIRTAIAAATKWQAWLEARDAAAAAKRHAEAIIAADVWMAQPDEELLVRDHTRRWQVKVVAPRADHPREAEIIERRDRLAAEAQRRNTEAEAASAERARQHETTVAAAKARRASQLAAWLAQHGTDSQRRRAARKMLPEEEIMTAIRDAAFAPLARLARYKRLTAEAVTSECDNDGGGEVEFSADDATEASDAEFARLEEVEAAAKDAGLEAECKLRRHVGRCGDCEVQRASILVTATVGELTLSREFAV